MMKFFLSPGYLLKWLEFPALYSIREDELYELDEPAFSFLRNCAGEGGCEHAHCDRQFIEYAIGEGILTTKQIGMKRPVVKASCRPSLRYLELQITRKCNLRCSHCYLGEPAERELSLKRITRVLREFEEMQGLRLLLTGGEPLLHSDFHQINATLPNYAFRKILLSNGTLLTGAVISSLHVDELQISIDGLESGHEVLRGRGTYKKAMKAIEAALGEGMDVSVSTMVHSGNLREFEEMERLFKNMGIKDWSVDVPCIEGKLRGNPFFQVRPETAGKFLQYGFGEGLHGGGEGFACGLHLSSVMADGGVARCAFYSNLPAGQVDEGLEACWRRIVPLKTEELTCDCDVKEICRGGCRYRANLLGNPVGKDLYRCYAFDVSHDQREQGT